MVTFSTPRHVRRAPAEAPDFTPVRTSDTHPMTVSWVAKSTTGGRFGLTFCPGKNVNRGGVQWRRNLDADLDRLQEEFGVSTILCLLSQAELNGLKLRDYEDRVRAKGFQFISFPIVEMAAPDSLKQAAALIELIQEKLCEGEVMIIHCRGGVGRAGLIASCLLLKLKMATSALDAITKVRKLRCRSAVESYSQEQFIAKYANFIRERSPTVHGDSPVEWEIFKKKNLSKHTTFLTHRPTTVEGICEK